MVATPAAEMNGREGESLTCRGAGQQPAKPDYNHEMEARTIKYKAMYVCLLFVLVVVAACESSSTPVAAPTSAPAMTQAPAPAMKLLNGKIVIGIINDQSGVYADLGGKNVVEAVEMAIEDYMAKYGDKALGGPVEVINADHQNNPDVASTKAQEFIDRDKADLLLDLPTSAAALAVAKVVGEKRKVYINVSAATADLTGASCNKYTFHYAYDTFMLAAGTGTWVTQNVGKKWFIIYPNYTLGQDMNRYFTNAIRANGGSVLASEPSPFPNQTGDFSAQLLKASPLKPEVIGVMQAGADLVNVVKQYNELKLKDQGIKLAIGLLFDTDINSLGPDAFAGVVYTTPWNWTQDADARAWADKFLKRTGTRPTFAHAGNYSATWQYLEAVRRAGTDDADAVVKTLEGYKFSDFFIHNGTIRAEDHYVAHDVLLAQVKARADVAEPWDYSKIIGNVSADKTSRPLAESGCTMPK
jgi:branched-chain amino acid transport system substrate-binding protein